jgi:outer membrane protein assembly factor BamB
MPSRRRYLTAIASGAGLTVLAGCLTDEPPADQPATTTPPDDLAGSWTHRDADPQASSTTDSPGFDAAPTEAWSVAIDGHVQVRLAGGDLLTATDTRLAGRSLSTGEADWTHSFDGDALLGAVLDAETVYATVEDSAPTLRALGQRADGDAPMLDWTAPGLRFRRADGDVVVATTDTAETLVALDPDGNPRWRLPVDDLSVSGARFGDVVLGPDHVFTAVQNAGSVAWVYGVDRATGDPRWHADGPNHAASLTVTDDRVLSGGFYGGVYGWHHDGSGGWETTTTPPVGDIVARDGRAFVTTSGEPDDEPTVTALATDGERLWTRATGGVTAADADTAYVVDDAIVAVDPATGDPRWTLDTPPGSVVPADGGLFVLAADGETRTLRLFV